MQFDTLQIEMIWIGNILARIPLTQWGSVYFDNQFCCSATPLFAITYTGGVQSIATIR